MKQSPAAPKNDPKNDARAKADLAVAQIKKQFGDGSIMRLGETQQLPEVQVVPTGSLALDIALGVGGVPRGRVIEIYGPEGSGKTTLAQSIIANAQRAGGIAAFIDAEHAFDVVYSRKLGVDADNLLVSQPDTGEQALDIVEVLVRSGAVDIIVVDSVAALVPRAEIEGEMGDSHVGLQARLMSQALRKLAGIVNKTNTCVIFINQIRMKIGILFGNPETTTGGNALKFYSSVRLDIRRIANLKEGEDIVGNRTKVKVVKNKVAPPFRTAEFDIIYGEGISLLGDIVDLGAQCNVIDKSGTWFTYGSEKLGQGRERAKQFLRENPTLARTIEKQIRAHYSVGVDAVGATAAGAAPASATTPVGAPAGAGVGAPVAASSAVATSNAASNSAAASPVPSAAAMSAAVGNAPTAAKPAPGAVGGTPDEMRMATKNEAAAVVPNGRPDAKLDPKTEARPAGRVEARPDPKAPLAKAGARPAKDARR
jgi:recombination protein RecA